MICVAAVAPPLPRGVTFTASTHEQMISDWLKLRQGSKTVDECEAEFNRLLRFAGVRYHEDELMKVQKFQDGLRPDLRYAIKTFELTTLSAVAHKAKVIEQSKRDCSAQLKRQAKFLVKRPFSSSSAPRVPGKSIVKGFKKTSGFQSSSKRFKSNKKPDRVE